MDVSMNKQVHLTFPCLSVKIISVDTNIL